jgi:acetyltransferase
VKAHLEPLFDPQGVVVVGTSEHPGKFGFVTLHNILAGGYAGAVHATGRVAEVLGVPLAASVDDLPRDARIDLAVVCTPASENPEVLRACARRGIAAVYVVSAGYAENGHDGEVAQASLVELAQELGIVLAGPNGQGLVSTPSKLCAQIVGPNPPRGRIAVVSQSGNLASSVQNLASASGIGISRAVSVGNAGSLSVADYLAYLAHDPETAATIVYVESVPDGRAFYEQARAATAVKPVVLLKGGSTSTGQRAAQSHTGALATDDRVFSGMCRQAGISRVHSVEEAFDAAAAFVSQPLPRGPNVAVLTSAGGWGVLTADALASSSLTLADISPALRAELDRTLTRWSRSNPVDLSGAETRDTVPGALDAIAHDPSVDAVIYLGLGIQSNQAKLMRDGPFFESAELARIVEFHERQDARFAAAAQAASDATGKPVLIATELVQTDPGLPGPSDVRAGGGYCFSSSLRAVSALEHLWRYARYRNRIA